jgi:transposase
MPRSALSERLLGRKNYLFARSDTGGERAAAIYTLIGTAKLNDRDPEAYLRSADPNRRSPRQSHR